MAYKRILLATHLSSLSNQVAKKAKELADLYHAKLSIIHVAEHHPIAYGGEFSVPIDAEVAQEIEQQTQKQLTKLSKRLDIPEKNQYLEYGAVTSTILEVADKLKAQLIVVGDRSHHRFTALLGSQANSISIHAKCDVFIVRTHKK